ncbi:MAG: Spy/CpxP family protein refolding chaperone [Burkholderiales bacterium]|nr:Spy/CpxP family protein refolding chaperone [Burkholderiales bacterium]
MKLPTKIMLGLISALFAASVATAAERGAKKSQYNHHGMYCNSMGMMPGDMGRDPVASAQKHLDELKAKLNLTNDQQAAWQTFSDQVNEQAKTMAVMRDKMMDKNQAMPKTAPEQMALMADRMKDQARHMDKMADAVKAFYATLKPEQQTSFDKIHMSHMGMGNMNRKGDKTHAK